LTGGCSVEKSARGSGEGLFNQISHSLLRVMTIDAYNKAEYKLKSGHSPVQVIIVVNPNNYGTYCIRDILLVEKSTGPRET
jgi:hypothetical protein